MHKVLVDGGQFVLELGLQPGNDLCITFHGGLLLGQLLLRRLSMLYEANQTKPMPARIGCI
jgi:hypothetical protein